MIDAERLARLFYESSERRRGSEPVDWLEVPEPSRSLMIAVAQEVIDRLSHEDAQSRAEAIRHHFHLSPLPELGVD